MVRRLGTLVATVLLATLVLAACGSEQGEVEPTVTRIPDAANAPVVGETPETGGSEVAAETPETGGEAAASGTTFDVEMVDIAFTQKELVVPANTEITINLVNNGAAVHNFLIDELGVVSEDYMGGQSGTITFNTGAPGEYEYYCSIPGHREAGMIGKLIVVEGSAEPAAEATSEGAEATASPVAADGDATPVGDGAALPTSFDIELLDIRFDKTELTIPANTDVTINATNNGAAVHNFIITDTDFGTRDLLGGESESITINLPPGEYEYYCSIPGHREAGMVGKLIVVEGSTGDTATATEPADAAATEPAASGDGAAIAGDVARGQTLAAVCLGCHSVDGSTLVGPSFKGLVGSTVTLQDGSTVVADAAYITESIREPNAKVHQGFAAIMPPFPYTDQEIADIIAYMETLR